jgi:hypothetical protein
VASKLRGQIIHFKRDGGNSADEIRNRRVRFETHPLHAKFAFLVDDDKELQVFQVGLARPRFSRGNSDVMAPAHCFSLSEELNSTLSLPGLKLRPRDWTFEARSRFALHWYWERADSRCMAADRKVTVKAV